MKKIKTDYIADIRAYKNKVAQNNLNMTFIHPAHGTKRTGKTLSIRSGTQKITLTGREVSTLRDLLALAE